MDLLKFSLGNSKLPDCLIFSLRAGHDCPFAHLCHTRVYPDNPSGKKIRHFGIEKGLEGAFGCYAAGVEMQRPAAFRAHEHNRKLLDEHADLVPSGDQFMRATTMVYLIDESIKHADPRKRFKRVRIHVSGDFYSYEYMWAWLRVADLHPDREFYAYTKSLPFWLAHHQQNHFPAAGNFKLTASAGGRADSMIDLYEDVFTRVAYVVMRPEDAMYPIEHGEDEYCFLDRARFCHVVHGHQPKGTELARQTRRNSLNGYGYSKENLESRREQVKQLVELHV